MRFISTLTAVVALTSALAAADPATTYPAVLPLLKTYCHKCHDAGDPQGGVDFASLTADDVGTKAKLWKRAKGRVDDQEMPPEDGKQPTPAERKLIGDWLGTAAGFLDCDSAKRDPGPAPLRRLTQAEYGNTLRDLLGFPFNAHAAVGFPDEPTGEGRFENLAVNLRLSDVLMERYFAAADAALTKLFTRGWPMDDARRKLLGKPIGKESDEDAAKRILASFARRAFRRPPEGEDVIRLVALYRRARVRGETHEDGLRASLKPVLVSPQFLFRIERDRPHTDRDAAKPGVPVDAHELATRLSYFLWSTMPDAELMKLADDGRLADPAVLDAQTLRLLNDPKSKAFTEHFGLHWLQYPKLATARPTTEFFPAFKAKLKESMTAEASALFDHLRTDNRPLTDLLHADYTFVDATLAKHYGIDDVTGDKLRKVTLKPGDHRGGILGLGGVLALTSHTFRTSPTQRGKYVLEVILGTPPPPPPPNAGTIAQDADEQKKQPKTFREQLAAHASQASCAGCHKKIDPLGFALDQYDAVGRRRESTAANPLDVSGILPDGARVNGMEELRAVLLTRKPQFLRNVAGKVLEYALGRDLDAADECTLADVQAALAADGDRFRTLILAVVRSVPFRERRAGR